MAFGRQTRLDWTGGSTTNGWLATLHKRQLLLPGRTSAFDLPPATVIVGQYPVGNESDSEALVRDHYEVRNAWSAGQRLW